MKRLPTVTSASCEKALGHAARGSQDAEALEALDDVLRQCDAGALTAAAPVGNTGRVHQLGATRGGSRRPCAPPGSRP